MICLWLREVREKGKTMGEKDISKNAKKAEEIIKELPKEVRAAADAMQRTIRSRKAAIYYPKKHGYKQIY